MKNNKKGISAVVATVLIILITIAAVTIIWAAIIPMINDQLARGTVCLDATSALSIQNKGYTCNNPGIDVDVQVAYGSQNVDLAGIQILVSDDLGDTTAYKELVAGNLPTPNGEKVLTVPYTGTATAVKIAPMVNVGGQVEICDASASVALLAC